MRPLENKVLAAYQLSKAFTAAYNNYLTQRYSLQRASKRYPSVYTKDDLAAGRAAMLATWKNLKKHMRDANEYKQF